MVLTGSSESDERRRRTLVYWRAQFAPGVEELKLDESSEGVIATGVMTVHRGPGMIAFHEDAPFRVRYRLECDTTWRVRALQATAADGRRLDLAADGAGRWRGEPALDGAIDVDIAASGFTNTVTIRRLGLAPGESREEQVTYVGVPALRVERVVQRYTRLDGTRYRYENLTTPYVNDIEVDAAGLVVDYPGILTRVWPHRDRMLAVAAVVERGGAVLSEPVTGDLEHADSPPAEITRLVMQRVGLDTEVVAALDAADDQLVFHCRVRAGSPIPPALRWVTRTEPRAGLPDPVGRLLALPTD